MKITGITSALLMFENGFVPKLEGVAPDMGLLLNLSKRPDSVVNGDSYKDGQSSRSCLL